MKPFYLHTSDQKELHLAFVKLWDKAVGTKDYEKAQWLELDRLLQRMFRAQDEQIEFQRGIMEERDRLLQQVYRLL